MTSIAKEPRAADEPTLLCLNGEWRGCTNPAPEAGARRLGAELFGSLPFLDLGPDSGVTVTRDGVFALDAVAGRFASALEAIRREEPARLFTIGGTCASEAAPIVYLLERYRGDLGVVWLDAHGDLNTPGSSPSGSFHGMVLRTLLGAGPIEILGKVAMSLDPEHLLLAGVRDLDEAEERFVDAAGLAVIRGWPETAAASIADALGDMAVRHIYVHLDVDVFAPSSFGDAVYTVPGGPTLEHLGAAIRGIGDAVGIVGIGVTEYCGRVPGSASRLRRMLIAAGVWPPASIAGASG